MRSWLTFGARRSGAPSAREAGRALRYTAALVFTPDGRYGLFQGPDGNIHFTEHLGGSSFTPSVPVPDLSTRSFEGEPFITADGCEVFFVRDGSNDWDIFWDIFRARVVP